MLDFASSSVAANLTVSSSFIQSLAGAGNASALTLHVDTNDNFTVDPAAFTDLSGSTYTYYSDAAKTQQIAQLTLTVH